MKKTLGILVLFLVYTSSSFSQTEEAIVIADQHFKKGDSLIESSKFKASIKFTQKALSIYKPLKTWDKIAASYNNISVAYWKLHQHEHSLSHTKEAWRLCETHLPKNHKERGATLMNFSHYYNQISNHEKSIHYLNKALEIFKTISPYPKKSISAAFLNLANNYMVLSQYSKALEYHLKGLSLNKEIYPKNSIKIGIAYTNLGNIYLNLGMTQKALECHETFLNSVLCNYDETHLYAGFAYLNISSIKQDQFETDQALENLSKALPIFLKEENPYGLLKTYHSLGNAYRDKGQYSDAVTYYEKSIYIATATYGPENFNVAYSQIAIAEICLLEKNNKKALSYLNKALNIYKKTYKEDNLDLAYLYHILGEAHIFINPEKALKYHLNALDIKFKLKLEGNLQIAYSYMGISNHYFLNKQYLQSINYQNKALHIISNSLGKNHLRSTRNHLIVGMCHKKLGNLDLALKSFDNSLRSNRKKKTNSNVTNKDAFNPDNYWDLLSLLRALNLKGIIFKTIYKKNNDITYLQKALVCFEKANSTIKSIRQNHQHYKDKIQFSEEAKKTYDQVISTLILSYNTHKDAFYLDQIFNYLEESTSNTLRELVNMHVANANSELPKPLLTSIKSLKTNKAFYTSQIIQHQSKEKKDVKRIMALRDKLFNSNQKIDSITKLIEKQYTKHYQLKHQTKIIQAIEVQQKLPKHTTLLKFYVADSTTYAFTISKDNYAVKELATPELTEKINAFRKATISKNIKQYKTLGLELYNTLIAPIQEELIGDELIIVPDGPLWHLNFEVLLSKKAADMSPKTLPYLLRDYAITYANSASLLFNTFRQKKQKNSLKGCLAFSFSDPTNTTSNTMSLATLRAAGEDLPGTRKEIKAISKIVDGQYYFGAHANEANFKKNAGNYTILHLALHGDVDNENPENSKLYFTKSKDSIEDDLLYSHELFALNIPTELTVLSACNTGTGKIAKGEGIMSLGNAFQYAGTKSLLLSSWEIPDDTTPQLMQNFYTNLKEGMNKSKALQQAKLQYLQQADLYKAAPFYWGGFYLIGNPAPINLGGTNWWYWGIGILAIALIALFALKRKTV